MNFSLTQFQDVARRNWFNNDIVLNANRDKLSSQFFHSKSKEGSTSRVTNEATMKAFREALMDKYGMTGERVFKAMLGDRASNGRSLRKSDVLETIAKAQSVAERTTNAFQNETSSIITHILEDNPFLKSLSEEDKAYLRKHAMKWMERTTRLQADPLTARKNYSNDMDKLALRLERVIWKELDEPTGRVAPTRKEGVAFAKQTDDIPETGKGKKWTEGDTQALLLDLHDKTTQARMSYAFSERVESTRMANKEDPMVKAWDEAHEKGAWKNEKAFVNFARTFADRLPYGLTIAANSVIEKALKDSNSGLCEVALRSLPELKLNTKAWHIKTDKTFASLNLDSRENQYQAELSRDNAIAHRVVAQCDALLAEAKGAISVCEARKDAKAVGVAKKHYAVLEEALKQLLQATDKVISGIANADADEDEVSHFDSKVADLEAKFKELSDSFHREVQVDPKADFTGEARVNWLKSQIALAREDAMVARATAEAEQEKHLVVYENAKGISGLIDRQVYPTEKDPKTNELISFDKDARNDAISKRVADSFRASVSNLGELAGDISRVRDELRGMDEKLGKLTTSAREEASEAKLLEILDQAEELRKAMAKKSTERQEEFAERGKMMDLDNAMENSPMLLGIKTRYFLEIRQALIDFAKADGGATPEGRVLSRFA